MGFEPTQLALVELESTPLDHSGKVSLVKWLLMQLALSSVCFTCVRGPRDISPCWASTARLRHARKWGCIYVADRLCMVTHCWRRAPSKNGQLPLLCRG